VSSTELSERPNYSPRPVVSIASPAGKRYALTIHQPDPASDEEERRDFWVPFAEAVTARIRTHCSTLIFRRLATRKV
jgi:hypothetical protein